MKTNSFAIVALFVCSFFLNCSQKTVSIKSTNEESDQQIEKINPESEMLMRIDQLLLKVDSINVFIRDTQTAATELQNKNHELDEVKKELEKLKSGAKDIEDNHKAEKGKLNEEIAKLSKEKEALEKRVISPEFCKAIMRNNAVMNVLSLETLIESATDQSTKDDLNKFQKNSKIISAAETFFRDGSNRVSYGKIYMEITTLMIDTKFPEQAKEAEELKFKMIYFESYIENVNKLILSLKDVTDKTSREDEIERSDSFQKIKSLKWLADLCKSNMNKHVDLGINFEQ